MSDGDPRPTEGGRGVAIPVLFTILAVGLITGGLGVAALVRMEADPPEPLGNLVALVYFALMAGGFGAALISTVSLWLQRRSS
jgi:hypothetical protein